MGARTRGSVVASQVSAGRKNRLSIEVYGSKILGRMGPGAAQRTLGRPPRYGQPDHPQRPVAAQARGARLRRSARRPYAKATTTHSSSSSAASTLPSATPGHRAGIPAVRRWTAPTYDPQGRVGKPSDATLDRCSRTLKMNVNSIVNIPYRFLAIYNSPWC